MMPFYIKNVIKIVKIILVLEFFLYKTSAPVLQGYWIGNSLDPYIHTDSS